jgi:V/A-type H+-transporting ATPase subunit I
MLRVDWLLDQDNGMTFCLLLGAIHLSLAHAWHALRMLNSPKALAQAGWILVIWFMYAAARYLLLGAAFPPWLWALIILGLTGIVRSVVLQREWMGFAMLPQDIIASFGDLVSYLRLFALGVASVQVANAFNTMAGELTVVTMGLFNNAPAEAVELGYLAAAVAAALIVILGHGLNLILCAMSVLVHGVRLNALEFSMHIGQEWTGRAYDPFRRLGTSIEPAS